MTFRRFRTPRETVKTRGGIKWEIRKRVRVLCETRYAVEAGSGEVDNVMADYTPWHLTRAAVAPHKRNRIYGGTMGPATLLKGG
jgi:hypothetical protein